MRLLRARKAGETSGAISNIARIDVACPIHLYKSFAIAPGYCTLYTMNNTRPRMVILLIHNSMNEHHDTRVVL